MARHEETAVNIPRAVEKRLDDLYELIDGIEVAMMTTRRRDGHLVSRPMETQARRGVADLWFVTDIETNKLDELQHDPHVNLGYYADGEWVSVSGIARISQDRDMIHELYDADWRAWFGDQGGPRDGGPDDPRIALILVEAHSAFFLEQDKPTPVVLFEIAKGIVTGDRPELGEVTRLGPDDIDRR